MVGAVQQSHTDKSRFWNVVLYQILLAVLIGAVIGYIARRCLKYCEGRK